MAIPGTPQQVYVTQGNGQVLIQWNISAGATLYPVQRSTDGVTFTTVASPVINQYLDTAVVLGTNYYYQVAATGSSGTSPYSSPQSIIPTPTGEMSLSELRIRSLQRADRLNSQFISLPELNSYINQSLFELYDLLVTVYEDQFIAPFAQFVTNGNDFQYPLPDGKLSFTNLAGQSFVAPPYYKLLGVDLGINTANNAYVTINRFQLIDRNRYLYPNSASTIYGIFNMQYRVMGTYIEFIPTPSGNQPIRLLYIPRMPQLLLDTDITITGVSGWLEYVITDVAIKILQKEESDVSVLAAQKMALIKRINDSASNRDAGIPDHISDIRQVNGMGGWPGSSGGGYQGGWAFLLPVFANYNIGHRALVNPVLPTKLLLTYILGGIALTYLFGHLRSYLRSGVKFTGAGNFISNSLSAFCDHVSTIIKRGSQEQMVRPNTFPVVTFMTHLKALVKAAISGLVDKARSCSRIFSAPAKLGIPANSEAGCPLPTFIRLVNLTPETSKYIIHNAYSMPYDKAGVK